MSLLISILFSAVLLPASSVYNAYVSHHMNIDVPPAVSGPEVPIRDYAKPILIQGEGKKAVLMIHGFSGSPRDFGRLPSLFSAQGYDVIVPLLPAHGRGARALAEINAGDWTEYVFRTYEEIRNQYEEVTVIGLSMGSALSLLTAAEYADRPPEKLILLSPFFQVRQEWYFLLPIETYHDVLADYVPYLQSLPGQSAVCKGSPHAGKFVKRQYVATHASSEAFKVARAARQRVKDFAGLRVPTLMMQSREDRVTDYETTRKIVESLGSEHVRLVTLTRANHVLPRDCEAERIEEEILEFALS